MVDFIKHRAPGRRDRSPWVVLGVLCLGVFVINVSTLIVNIALPQLADQLRASTQDLLWIVDGFNLSFAALVLAAGSLSDRFGRRSALLIGLAVFALGSFVGATSGSPGMLIGLRILTGVGAAVIYPVTLSIIVNVFTDRRERAAAIGIWGAASGVAIGVGPLVGGTLVEHFWWGSILLFTGAVAVAALLLTLWIVPDSRDPATPRLDQTGLTLSTLTLGILVYSIIDSPSRGWTSPVSIVGFAVAAGLLALFVRQERRCDHPMLDVSLFANLRFTAASAAVTVAFFAMFGFIFLIVQYFQLLHTYGPFETGWRVLPVAIVTAPSAVIGVRASVRLGNKIIVAAGLLSFVIAFTWIATIHAQTSYAVIVGQMVFLGLGLGLSTAPATEAIMGVVPAAKAGVGSAVNDATRELGGTLGVAVIGSVALSAYRSTIAARHLPTSIAATAKSSTEAALTLASRLHATGQPHNGAALAAVARHGFLHGLHIGCLVAAAVNLAGALLVLRYLPPTPPRPAREAPSPIPGSAACDQRRHGRRLRPEGRVPLDEAAPVPTQRGTAGRGRSLGPAWAMPRATTRERSRSSPLGNDLVAADVLHAGRHRPASVTASSRPQLSRGRAPHACSRVRHGVG